MGAALTVWLVKPVLRSLQTFTFPIRSLPIRFWISSLPTLVADPYASTALAPGLLPTLAGSETTRTGKQHAAEEDGAARSRRSHRGGNMKKQVLALVGVLGLLLAAGSALAQTQKITADVPFNFNVNQTNMPAGPYTISAVGDNGGVLLIQGNDSPKVKFVVPNRVDSSKKADRTKLVFHCYGSDHCFLYQVWVGGMSQGRQLPASAVEKEVAANLHSRSVAVIAANQ
jgi:hypothetical protein